MTTYGFDAERGDLIAMWPVGIGSQARMAGSAATVNPDLAVVLGHELTGLSAALWDTYVRPASAVAGDEQERWRREEERKELDAVVGFLRAPNQPDESGIMSISYSPVQEAAHRVGRLLHRAGDPPLIDAVVAEVRTEIDAVERAELGDLTGRAVQAVALDRVDASPVQVAAVDAMLNTQPLGPGLLTAGVDPAAACVAAAHWLAAAAVVAGEQSGNTPDGVFAEADDIQAVSIEVPSFVVSQILDEERTPAQVVGELLRAATAAGRGEIADLPGILAGIEHLHNLVIGLPPEQREAALSAEPTRSTPLDPRRPARDLLEHLLDGITSCHVLYHEYVFDTDDEVEDQPGGGGKEPTDVEEIGERDDEWYTQRRDDVEQEFIDLVRVQAAACRSRLM